jgi:hypothetical protein
MLARLAPVLAVGFAAACLAPPALAAAPAACMPGQLAGYAPSEKEVAGHRKFTLPTLRYPFNTRPGGRWGLSLTLTVDDSGQIMCYRIKDELGKDQTLNDQRRGLLEQLNDWRYTPFTQGKQKVNAVFSERINEEELPREHVALPEAPVEALHVHLDRGECFGTCPVYSVDIAGDGKVIFKGQDYVDVLGEHRYEVPREDIARLLAQLRSSDLWSTRSQYRAAVTDIPTFTLSVKLGQNEHRIVDYGGRMAGMPVAVTEFEEEVDKIGHTEKWVSFSGEALERLKAEHFNFHSREAGNLLVRAVAGSQDEKAMIELVSLGAPINGTVGEDDRLRSQEEASIIEEALLNNLPALADALIAQGTLQTGGKLDQRKLDAAFRAAVVGGRLAQVQKIWGLGGDAQHPALTFMDPVLQGVGGGSRFKPLPVTLLLSPVRAEEHAWEGLQLVKWLEAQGCDLKAVTPEGITLLNVAVTARDIELVRYLISQGVKDMGSGQQGASALQGTQDEEIALLLLQSGASMPRTSEAVKRYQTYAESRHWSKVTSWLQAHPQ